MHGSLRRDLGALSRALEHVFECGSRRGVHGLLRAAELVAVWYWRVGEGLEDRSEAGAELGVAGDPWRDRTAVAGRGGANGDIRAYGRMV